MTDKLLTADEFIAECRRPFHPDTVLSRVQVTKKDQTAALVVYYIDARVVTERLNQLLPGRWSNRFEPVLDEGKVEGMLCTIRCVFEQYESEEINRSVLERSDIGTKDAPDDMGGLKAMVSDAFKRAAVHLGIAVSLYAQPQIWVPLEKDGTTYLKSYNDKINGLTKDGVEAMDSKYTKWLEDTGEKVFGKMLDPIEVGK